MILIITSVTTFCMETVPFFSNPQRIQSKLLYHTELLCVTWFTVEFAVRAVFCPQEMQFIKSLMNWIDFCAILPFFPEIGLSTTVKTIVVLRVVRIFKLSRHSYGLQILGHTLKSSCRELFLFVFFLSIGVIIFSSLVYYAEKDENGKNFLQSQEHFGGVLLP